MKSISKLINAELNLAVRKLYGFECGRTIKNANLNEEQFDYVSSEAERIYSTQKEEHQKLGLTYRETPKEIAHELKICMRKVDFVEKVNISANGNIEFKIDDQLFQAEYGNNPKKEKMVIEFPKIEFSNSKVDSDLVDEFLLKVRVALTLESLARVNQFNFEVQRIVPSENEYMELFNGKIHADALNNKRENYSTDIDISSLNMNYLCFSKELSNVPINRLKSLVSQNLDEIWLKCVSFDKNQIISFGKESPSVSEFSKNLAKAVSLYSDFTIMTENKDYNRLLERNLFFYFEKLSKRNSNIYEFNQFSLELLSFLSSASKIINISSKKTKLFLRNYLYFNGILSRENYEIY